MRRKLQQKILSKTYKIKKKSKTLSSNYRSHSMKRIKKKWKVNLHNFVFWDIKNNEKVKMFLDNRTAKQLIKKISQK